VKRKDDFGFNARSEKFESLDDAGVIGPAEVVRSALENAVSAASLLITTEAGDRRKTREARSYACDASWWWHRRYGRNVRWHGLNGWYGRLRRRRFLVSAIMCSLLSSQTHYLARYCEDESRLLYFSKFVAVTICVV
jgi:hypothetical protein